TSGHPQLVHARISVLEANGFPAPESRDILETPEAVLDVHAEARRLLALLERPSRELIYRLSLTINALSRDQIVAIAAAPPALLEPGNALDRLIGPWIEQIGEGIFRVSPLVRNSGEAVHGADWVRTNHSRVAWALLRGRTLTPYDVSAVLFHALASRDEAAIARLAFGLMDASTEVWRAIGDATFWLLHIGVATNLEAPVQNRATLFMFRVMQLRIAMATGHEALAGIVDRALDEFPPDDNSTLARVGRHILLSEVLLRSDKAQSLPQSLGWALEYVQASGNIGDVFDSEALATLDPSFIGPSGSQDFAVIAGFGLFQKIENRTDLHNLVTGLEPWSDNLLRRTFWMFEQDELLACHVLDRVWLAELKLEAPAWADLLGIYERFYVLVLRCGLNALARAAAKTILRTIDENLEAPATALERAAEFVAEIGDSPSLQAGRALVIMHAGDNVAALDLWRSALPRWKTSDADLAPSVSYRAAAIAAARLVYWDESAELFLAGTKRIPAGGQATFRIGMIMDAGFAYWKAGNNAQALFCFATGIEELDRIQTGADVDPGYSLQRRASHTLMWVNIIVSGSSTTNFSEPLPGFCSQFDPMDGERVRRSVGVSIWSSGEMRIEALTMTWPYSPIILSSVIGAAKPMSLVQYLL
ncbi:MAG: hypothetical protein QGG84_05040, partial [Rhodospirillales bacterium]|nr:hypothetical protein [Rhodospirillales bacterium]